MNDIVSLQQEKITALESALQGKNQRIVELEELLRLLNRKTYGASSEQQGQLFDEAELEVVDEKDSGDEDITTVPGHTRKRTHRPSIPPHIPREDVLHDLPEAEKVCPHDGTALKRIGEETHEQLDIIPAKVKCLRHIRLKYACPCCEQHIVTAKKPKQAIEKSLASPGLLAFVATSKYADAVPSKRDV